MLDLTAGHSFCGSLNLTARGVVSDESLHARQSDFHVQGVGRKKPSVVGMPEVSGIAENPGKTMLTL
jgi:hypothetical protein